MTNDSIRLYETIQSAYSNNANVKITLKENFIMMGDRQKN